MNKTIAFFKDITQAALLTLLESDNNIECITKGEKEEHFNLTMILKDEQAIVVYSDHIQLLTLDPVEGLTAKDINHSSYKSIEVY